MVYNDSRKQQDEQVEKLYYKPHFGPEETDLKIQYEREFKLRQKAFVNQHLQMQMKFKSAR